MKLFDGIKNKPKEYVGNVILLVSLVCAFMSTVICSILDEFHIFYLGLENSSKMSIAGLFFVCILLALFFMVHTDNEVLFQPWFKYYLLMVLFMWLLINCSIVYFHSTLLLLFPIFISRCYDSSKVTHITAIGTIMLIIATPFLAYAVGGMDVTFPSWYISIIRPEFADNPIFSMWKSENLFSIDLTKINVYGQIFLWVVIPRIIIVASLILVSISVNNANMESNKRQIRRILGLQDYMVDYMSEVIENRDESTGGHVRRTQDNVKILIPALKREFDMPQKFWDDIVKSAAMHDLGKIAVSDIILNKPGKLTKDEFEEIKKHPVKSKIIIDKLFVKIDDKDLLQVAQNVALYHHERYDGTGYPEGLKGDDIPLEARIMAIADVYDALVSERVYKKPYKSEEAYNIVKESMGSHFDPKLWNAFDKSFAKLEKYYKVI